jgi:hypothetical protein
MPLSDKRWQIVTKSAFEWGRNALNFIRERRLTRTHIAGGQTLISSPMTAEFTKSIS